MSNFLSPAAGWRRRTCAPVLAGAAALTVGAIAFAPSAGAAKPAGSSSSSSYLAGYQADPSGGLASASTTFTMPKITCNATQKDEGDAILFGVYTDDFNVYAFATAQCSTSGTAYTFDFSTPDGEFSEPSAVAPGDVVVASLFESKTDTQAEIHDLSRGTHWLSADPGDIGDTVVDIGTYNEETGGIPVAPFAKVSFTNNTVNGDYLGFDSPTQYNALNGGDTLIKTSALKTSATGSAFSLQYKKSS
jgi:hypothetical protein